MNAPTGDTAMKTGHEKDISYRFTELLEAIAHNPKCSAYFGIERAKEECGDGSSGESLEPRAAVAAGAETTNDPETADTGQTTSAASVSSILGVITTSGLGRKLYSLWRWILSGGHTELETLPVHGPVLGGPPRPLRC
jgi:hypothetical protein